MQHPNILVVGSMNMDLTVYGIQGISEYGDSVVAESYYYSAGGKGANQAYAAALQNANVTMVGRVGNDLNGNLLKDNLCEQGVNTNFIVKDNDKQTGLAQIFVNQEGEYFSYVTLGANNNLRPADVEKAINDFDYDMILMQLEMPSETVYQTYEMAVQKDIPVFLDAGPAKNIALERMQGLYILSPNEIEAEKMTGIKLNNKKNIIDAAVKLFNRSKAKYIILKLGARGSFIYDGIDYIFHPAIEIVAEDSTGAGDTFNAVLAVKLANGCHINTAIKYATVAAGICVSRKGSQSSIPNYKEIQKFMDSM